MTDVMAAADADLGADVGTDVGTNRCAVELVDIDGQPLDVLPLRFGAPMSDDYYDEHGDAKRGQKNGIAHRVSEAVALHWPEVAHAADWFGGEVARQLQAAGASKSLASTFIHGLEAAKRGERPIGNVLAWRNPVLSVRIGRCVADFGPYTDSAEGHAADGQPRTCAREVSRLVCFDVETTGLYPAEGHRVIELAMTEIDPRSLETHRSVSRLINPQRRNDAAHINHISDSMLADAPRFGDLAAKIATFIDGAALVAHNLSFDQRFLAAEFERAGVSVHLGHGLCTYQATKTNLAQAGRNHGLELRNAHRAAGDTELLAQLVCGLEATEGWLDSGVVPVSLT